MASAVMAEQAVRDVDAQEHRRQVYGVTVVRILSRAHRDSVTNRPVDLALSEAVAGGRKQFAGQLIVWFIRADGILQVEIKRVPPIHIAIDVVVRRIVLVEIAEEHGPFVYKLRQANQRIHLQVTLAGIGSVHKPDDVRTGWNRA